MREIEGKFSALKLPREGSVAFTFAMHKKTGMHGICLGLGHALTTRAALELVNLEEYDQDKAHLIAGDYDLDEKTLNASGNPEHIELIKRILAHNGYAVK